MGYRVIGILQVALTMVLVFSLPLWKKCPVAVGEAGEKEAEAISLWNVVRIPGVKEILFCFFCYCAVEQTTGLWASSYLTLYKHHSDGTGSEICQPVLHRHYCWTWNQRIYYHEAQ